MNKKKIVVMISAGLLALSALSGTAFAQGGHGNAEAVQEKIAEELDLDPQTVMHAFSTAGYEARNALIAARLAKSVESGTITEAEREEIQTWHEASPDAFIRIKKAGPRVDLERVAEILGMDESVLESAAVTARKRVAEIMFSERVDSALAQGRVTEEKAMEMRERFNNRSPREFGQGQREKRGRGFGQGHWGQNRHGGADRSSYGSRGLPGMTDEADDAPIVRDQTGFAA